MYAVAGMLVTACRPTFSLGGAAIQAETGGSTTGETGTVAASDGSPNGSPSGGGSGTSSSGDSSTSWDFDPPMECQSEPSDGACLECIKQSCCYSLAACATDPDCTCFYECIQQGDPVFQCQGGCMHSEAAGYLSMCAGSTCYLVCR